MLSRSACLQVRLDEGQQASQFLATLAKLMHHDLPIKRVIVNLLQPTIDLLDRDATDRMLQLFRRV